MAQIVKAQLKIIDFNHSRMFNLDDSPFRIRQRRRTLRQDITDEEVWQEMSELPSPQIWKSPNRNVGESDTVAQAKAPLFNSSIFASSLAAQDNEDEGLRAVGAQAD